MNKLATLILPILALGGVSVYAIYASTLSITMQGVADGGSPDLQNYTCSIGLNQIGDNATCNQTYFNDGGTPLNIQFTCTDLTVSNSSTCIWKPNMDAKVWIELNNNGTKNCQSNPIFPLADGANDINITIVPHPQICPSIAVDIGLVGNIV